jgi:hypothetical protein
MRRRIVGGLIAAVGLCAPASVAAAGEVDAADAGRFQVVSPRDGAVLCRSSWEVRRDGADSLFVEHGDGACHGFATPIRWELRTRFLTEDPGRLRESLRTIWTPDRAAPVTTTRRRYDDRTQVLTADVVAVGPPPVTRRRRWTGVAHVATPTSLLFVIRRSLARGERSGSMKLVTSEPSLYTIRWVCRGDEDVTVPAGTFRCVKVEVLIDLRWLSWLRPLLPKMFLWYVAAPPHEWVRYEGVEDGRCSSRVAIERTP